MEFTKKQTLKCIYCDASQDHLAIDAITFIPNLRGLAPPTYSTSVSRQQCGDCDQFFYVKLSGDKVLAENLPSKLYNR